MEAGVGFEDEDATLAWLFVDCADVRLAATWLGAATTDGARAGFSVSGKVLSKSKSEVEGADSSCCDRAPLSAAIADEKLAAMAWKLTTSKGLWRRHVLQIRSVPRCITGVVREQSLHTTEPQNRQWWLSPDPAE